MIGQQIRYSDKELSLLKSTFAEQEDIMILIRKFLLQGDINKEEMNLLTKYRQNPDVVAILKKAVAPELDKLAPPSQTVDLFTHMDLNPTPADHAYLIIQARHLAKKYLDQRFDAFAGKKIVKPISFDGLIEPEEDFKQTYINFIARNFLLPHIDSQLFGSLMIIAGTKEETPEEQRKRLLRDSNK